MPSWNASTSILYLDAAQTKPRVRRETEVLESWSLEIDYSRAPCLGADQKVRGLWERDWGDANVMVVQEKLLTASCLG